MIFDYFYMLQPTDSIEIDDTANVCLKANNDIGKEWYLSLNTHLGWTEVKEFGTLDIDEDDRGDNPFNLTIYGYEYNLKRNFKIISNFLNNDKRQITQVFIMTQEEFTDKLNNVKEYL